MAHCDLERLLGTLTDQYQSHQTIPAQSQQQNAWQLLVANPDHQSTTQSSWYQNSVSHVRQSPYQLCQQNTCTGTQITCMSMASHSSVVARCTRTSAPQAPKPPLATVQ